jgi:2-polyprenyl-3-methyl-5-hydroxy-6-metoxy-1,4-benzoquinol methylase
MRQSGNTSAACPHCGSYKRLGTGRSPKSPYLEGSTYNVVSCHGCGLLLTEPRPSNAELHEIYEHESYYSTSEAVRGTRDRKDWYADARRHLREKAVRASYARPGIHPSLIDRLVGRVLRGRFGWAPTPLEGNQLLDVGSGDGAFLLDAQKAGWDVVGLDVSSLAAKNAKSLGLNVLAGEIQNADLDPDSFDIVRLWSVLEHSQQPDVVLRCVHELLVPGGWAIIQVPNANSLIARVSGDRWPAWDMPIHLTHFTKKSLSAMAHDAGLIPGGIYSASVGTFAGVLGWTTNIPGRALIFVIDQIIDMMNSGDCIMLFARKPPAV